MYNAYTYNVQHSYNLKLLRPIGDLLYVYTDNVQHNLKLLRPIGNHLYIYTGFER